MVRLYPDGPFGQVAVEFGDSRCLLVSGFKGYVGHIRIEAEGMALLSHAPPTTSSRGNETQGCRAELDKLRAAATLAFEKRRVSIGDPRNPDALASAIRTGKAIDPALEFHAARGIAPVAARRPDHHIFGRIG